MIRREFRFEETLLRLCTSRNLGAKGFNAGNCVFKGLPSFGRLIESAVCIAGCDLSFPQGVSETHLPGQRSGAPCELQRLRVISLIRMRHRYVDKDGRRLPASAVVSQRARLFSK